MKENLMILERQDAIQATDALVADLRGAVGEIAFDRMTRLLYSTDASIYQMMPVGVAFPRHAEEIAAAMEIAARHGVPVLPRGGGSSLSGQAIGHALILDTSRYMRAIEHVDTEARTVIVEPGVILGVLNRFLRGYGLTFGPDPASAERAAIGGVVANNATGAHSIVYGMTSDHVLELDAILADGSMARFDALNGDTWAGRAKRPGLEGTIYREVGSILERYQSAIASDTPATWRNVAGYNLRALAGQDAPNMARLLAGSEGTLAVITRATLNLVSLPKRRRLALVHFSDVRASLDAVPPMLESGTTAIELLDKMLLDLARANPEYRHLLTFVEGDPAIIQVVEFSGDTDAELEAGVERLKVILRRIGHHDPLVVLSDPRQQANVWAVRKVGLGIFQSMRGDPKPVAFIEDAAVPVESLGEYITELFEVCREAGVDRVGMYAHASAGCLHVRPVVNLKTAEGLRQMRRIAEGSLRLVKSVRGTISSEHGDGMVRGEFLPDLLGADLMQACREVKRAFDPHHRMNPGKIIDAPRMDDERLLRYGTAYSVPLAPLDTRLSFASDGGFAGAVEMCNGAGVCRKVEDGVMCPSYMVTLDEAHSTRGRANALRAAMTGALGPEGMTSPELYDVMSLCLSCKACKAECPSSVDVAKLKTEFLYRYQKKHGVPLRSWVFANIALLNRLVQPFAPLANLMLTGPLKWGVTLLGVHRERSLPRYTLQPFSAWFRRYRRTHPAPQNGREVVLFHDTFMQHNDPQIGQAAVKVLEAGGYTVHVLENHPCCGRPAVSKGMLDLARRLAEQNIRLLAPYAERGIPIVGCEPSCMAMLVDEYPDL
ncbi:MAG: FAD-binding protein, partial [Anaerolineae bacterium]|nr:FAD-binding protein [Anaerolineae bacterium]